jgi:hypothetical protein
MSKQPIVERSNHLLRVHPDHEAAIIERET